MAKPGAGATKSSGGKPTQPLDVSAVAFMTDRIRSEIGSQIHFGKEWGPLVGCPGTIEEEIATKKAELEKLRAELAGRTAVSGGATAAAALGSSVTATQFKDSLRPDIEAGLKTLKKST